MPATFLPPAPGRPPVDAYEAMVFVGKRCHDRKVALPVDLEVPYADETHRRHELVVLMVDVARLILALSAEVAALADQGARRLEEVGIRADRRELTEEPAGEDRPAFTVTAMASARPMRVHWLVLGDVTEIRGKVAQIATLEMVLDAMVDAFVR